MNRNLKIKIIKKNDTSRTDVAKPRSRNTAREMVATVSDWVSDLKIRKSAEAKAALAILHPIES